MEEPRIKAGGFVGLSIILPPADVLLAKHKRILERNPKAKGTEVEVRIGNEPARSMTFMELETRLTKVL